MMSSNDIMAFSMLCEADKRESLSSIREIVCGMRIFNKDAGHCGTGLVDSKYTYDWIMYHYVKHTLARTKFSRSDGPTDGGRLSE